DAIYCSPLKRARETADIVALPLLVGVHELVDLRERGVGDLSGLTHEEARTRLHINRVNRTTVERRADFACRVTTVFEHMVNAHEGRSVAIVSHGGVINVICRWALGTPDVRFPLGNASLTIVDVSRSGATLRPQLVTVNDTTHLADLSLTTRLT